MADSPSATSQARSSEHNADLSRFTPAPKPRSCVVCRSRKVRCDKTNPCSNCRKSGVACVFPANDRPPKWARRLDRITKDAGIGNEAKAEERNVQKVMQRLQSLEGLVKELGGHLEEGQPRASPGHESRPAGEPVSGSSHDGTLTVTIPTLASSHRKSSDTQGLLVVQDNNHSRYLSSHFWSRMNDELNGLKVATQEIINHDSGSSDDESSSRHTAITQELYRTPSERHSFVFGHNLGSSSIDLREFHPLPSQIPFLLDTYAENVNYLVGILHMPTVRKIVRAMRVSATSTISSASEALLFSIYYAAVTSMEDEDVINNFGTTKAELNLKFRIGLEHSLAKADFLNVPDLILIQAFAIFLFLARRHDSPRFVWMMTGLLIRMAHSLGLQRDPSHFDNLKPYESEMRRRLWWAICLLDVRSSEDQGMELTITRDSFDTRLPSNIWDADLDADRTEPPQVTDQVTEITPANTSNKITQLVREMVATGGKADPPTIEVQVQLIDDLFNKLNMEYLSKEVSQPAYWMACNAGLLVMSKMRLLIYLPQLFNSPNQHFTEELRNTLLVSAIEVAEYNHALNSEKTVRQWKWIYQVYSHWYAIVYLLIEIVRRHLSPLVERAWVALQSPWLIPRKGQLDKNNQHWMPLRKLMARAKQHRNEEIRRLRNDANAVQQLEFENQRMPVVSSPAMIAGGNSEFLEHWRGLFNAERSGFNSTSAAAPSQVFPGSVQQSWNVAPLEQRTHHFSNMDPIASESIPQDWTGFDSSGGSTPWLWTDTEFPMDELLDFDPSMDMTADINWQNWLDTAKDLAQEGR